MAAKNVMRSIGKAIFLPLMVVACSTGMMSMKQAEAVNDNPIEKTHNIAPEQDADESQDIVNETFLIKELNVTYNSGGYGNFAISAHGQSGAKNTGTGAFRTDLYLNASANRLGAQEDVYGTNNAIKFTTVKYEDQRQNSNNFAAYVEFEIRTAKEFRKSVLPTNATAYTVYPAFARNLEDIDLDSVNINNAAATQSYGVKVLKFKGRVADFRIQSDLTKDGFRRQDVADNLVSKSSNGILLTSQSLNRMVQESEFKNTSDSEQMVPTPKNIFKPGQR